jgi:hypothetical protein
MLLKTQRNYEKAYILSLRPMIWARTQQLSGALSQGDMCLIAQMVFSMILTDVFIKVTVSSGDKGGNVMRI